MAAFHAMMADYPSAAGFGIPIEDGKIQISLVQGAGKGGILARPKSLSRFEHVVGCPAMRPRPPRPVHDRDNNVLPGEPTRACPAP
jgi:hypothetical protein